jgi:TP901 family phage tail tape measure protein
MPKENVDVIYSVKGDNKLKQATKKMSTSISGFIKNVVTSKLSLAALGIAIGVAVRDFAKFETAMVNVGNLVNATNKEVAELSKEVLDISGRLPQSAQQLSEALFDVVSAGVALQDSTKFLETSARLAISGVTTTAIAVDGLTSAANAYGIAFDKAGEISDKFFAAQKAGKTTIAELSSNIGKVAPIAAATGVSLDELLGTISTMTLQGIKTAEATTQIKAALTALVKPGTDAKKLAEDLGLEFNTQALEAKGLSGFLKDVMEKTDGNTEAMGKLFGSSEALNVMLALSKDGFETLDKISGDVTNSLGETDTAMEKMSNTFSFQFGIMVNNFRKGGIKFISFFQKPVLAGLKKINKTFEESNEKRLADLEFRLKLEQARLKDSQEGTTEAFRLEVEKRTEIEKNAALSRQGQLLSLWKFTKGLFKDRTEEELKNSNERIKLIQEEIARLKTIKDEEADEDEDRTKKKLTKQIEETKKALTIITMLNSDATKEQKAEWENMVDGPGGVLFSIQKILDAQKLSATEQIAVFKQVQSTTLELFQSMVDAQGNISFAALGQKIKEMLTGQLLAWAAAETTKAIIAAPLSFGASLGAIPVIAAQSAAGIAALNAIHFAKGGIVPGSPSEGDNQLIKATAGEAVLNDRQLGRLFEFVDSSLALTNAVADNRELAETKGSGGNLSGQTVLVLEDGTELGKGVWQIQEQMFDDGTLVRRT